MSEPLEELLRLAVDLSPSGLIVTDREGRIVLVNREVERLFGYDRSELVGQSLDLLIPERFRARHLGFETKFFRDPRARPMGAGRDLHGRRRDGTEIPLEIGLNPVQTERGTLVISSIVDISGRRELEDRLRQAQKMEAIGTLAGGIAHDFNNVLGAILGYTELVAAAITDRQAVADLRQVQNAAERGQQLVRRILAFGRQRDEARTPMRLERPLGDAIGLLRASLPRSIDLRSHFETSTPLVQADDTQVHQVVMNLVTNAAQAIGTATGVVEVTLSSYQADDAFARRHPSAPPGLWALVTVADTGPGMPPEVVDRAFEPFFTTKAADGGTGLGLSVVHGIVRSHGGVVELESEPQRGTTVRVYLPAAPAAPLEDAATEHGVAPHLLLVEDEETLAQLARRQLEAEGYRVTVHTSSLQALDDFRSRPHAFELIITDNTMPKMSGMALAHEVLRMRPVMKILLVSGLADTLDPGVIYSKGIAGILAKPHTGRQLVDAVRGLLGASLA